MSDFTAGFAARFDAAAQALHLSQSQAEGFAPADLKARAGGKRARGTAEADRDTSARGPVSFAPQPIAPRHFAPADPEHNPTEGWDPMTAATAAAAPNVVDPVAAARRAGYAEGFAAGHEQGEQERERDQALLRGLAETLKSAEFVNRDQIAARLRQTVLFLVAKMVGDSGIAPDLLVKRVAAATDIIADAAEAAILRLHPDDLPLVSDILPGTLNIIPDAAIERGGFILESAATIVEDGPTLWLEQLAHAIERVAVPPTGI
jgi:flagellar assembly protein FliH